MTEIKLLSRQDTTQPSIVSTHLDTLKTCLRKLNRIAIGHKSAIEESVRASQVHQFTVGHVRELDELRQTVLSTERAYSDNNLNSEIKHNLGLLQDEEHRKYYENQLWLYVMEADRCLEKVRVLQLIIDDVYDNLFERPKKGEAVSVGFGDYTVLNTPNRLAAAVYVGLTNISTFGIEDTKGQILQLVKPLRDLYYPMNNNPVQSSTGQKPEPTDPGVKLQWNCSPAIAGYIITELVRAGYIEPPKTNGELSYAKLARICNQLFDIRSDGKPTTLDYLKKVVNPESNPLPDYKRTKLNLPDLDQLI